MSDGHAGFVQHERVAKKKMVHPLQDKNLQELFETTTVNVSVNNHNMERGM